MEDTVTTNVIKRNGEEVHFDRAKIVNAITKANGNVERIHQMNPYQIEAIADTIAEQVQETPHAVNVEDIQDMVETSIMEMRGYEVAQKYVRYRYRRELKRKSNTTDNGILALLDHINEEVNQENSNKNPVINSTQRDYMAGEVSKDLSKRVLLPEEIVRAHEEGIIHFHDTDYFAQKEHNCDLINLEDMLQNGTVISETMIEKPHSFFTACNVTTQIVAQVASNQYGGQSFTLAHLAPFVDISRQKLRKNVIAERTECGEADGYAQHMTDDPLPGTPAHTVLMHVAFGDHQVVIVAASRQMRRFNAAAVGTAVPDALRVADDAVRLRRIFHQADRSRFFIAFASFPLQ